MTGREGGREPSLFHIQSIIHRWTSAHRRPWQCVVSSWLWRLALKSGEQWEPHRAWPFPSMSWFHYYWQACIIMRACFLSPPSSGTNGGPESWSCVQYVCVYTVYVYGYVYMICLMVICFLCVFALKMIWWDKMYSINSLTHFSVLSLCCPSAITALHYPSNKHARKKSS